MLFKSIYLSLISCLALQNFPTPLNQCIYKTNTYVKDEGAGDEYYFLEGKYKLVASLPEKDIKLYATRSCDYPGLYTKFVLKIKDDVRNFYRGWFSDISPSQSPILILSDVNDDKIDELIINCTVATGTGLRDEEIHIININPLIENHDPEEYFIDNPLIIIKEKVTTQMTKNEEGLLIQFKINDNEYTVKKDKKFAEHYDLDSGIAFNSGIEWKVINDKIYAYIDAGLSRVTLGNIVIEYKYNSQSQVFEVGEIYFKEDKRPKIKSDY